jgi:hypothetical protein
LPGRTADEAFRAFVEPLAETVSCIAQAKITVSPGGRSVIGRVHALTVNNDVPLAMRGKGRSRLLLWLRMQYEFISVDKPDHDPYKVSTRGYMYEIQSASGQAVVSWHWHPGSKMKEPHVHMGRTQLADDAVLSNRDHIATGRVSMESVVRTCIAELGVPARREDWDQVLALHEGLFKLHRSWH